MPAHAGGQVVQAEQVGEFVGVVGPALHGVEQGELLVQQDLAAAGEVHEDLGDAAAELGLFDGGLDGGPLEDVEGLADLADLVLLVLQARHLGLHVDLFARGEAAHHAGQPYAGGLVGLLAEPAQVADEAAADAYGHDERDQQRGQAEDPGDAGLDDDADRHGAHAVLEAVARLGVELVEPVEDIARDAVPALRGDSAGLAGRGGDDGLLGHAQRCGGGVLPVAVVAARSAVGSSGRPTSYMQRALGDQVGDVAGLLAGHPADDEGGAEEGVLTGEQLAGARRC